jgi:hypothetical protein
MSKRISRVETQEQSSGHITLLEARPQGILANYLTHGKVKNFPRDVVTQISNTDYQGNLRPQNLTNIPELIDPNKVFKIFKELGPPDIEQLTIFLNEHQHSIENIRFSRERYEFLDNIVILLLKNGKRPTNEAITTTILRISKIKEEERRYNNQPNYVFNLEQWMEQHVIPLKKTGEMLFELKVQKSVHEWFLAINHLAENTTNFQKVTDPELLNLFQQETAPVPRSFVESHFNFLTQNMDPNDSNIRVLKERIVDFGGIVEDEVIKENPTITTSFQKFRTITLAVEDLDLY